MQPRDKLIATVDQLQAEIDGLVRRQDTALLLVLSLGLFTLTGLVILKREMVRCVRG